MVYSFLPFSYVKLFPLRLQVQKTAYAAAAPRRANILTKQTKESLKRKNF